MILAPVASSEKEIIFGSRVQVSKHNLKHIVPKVCNKLWIDINPDLIAVTNQCSILLLSLPRVVSSFIFSQRASVQGEPNPAI